MARFSDDLINKIKSEVDLQRLVESQGYKTKKQGKDIALRCPFHDDDTASLIITPSKNLFNCFGCDAQGTVIDWMIKTQGVSFRHAVELLRDDHLPLAAIAAKDGSTVKPVKKATIQKLASPLAADSDSQTLMQQVTDYYNDMLKQSPEALDYLKTRGLDNAELIDAFKLGYANRTLAYRLPQKNRKAGAEIRGKLQAIGILRESGHEHFNGSLVVPVVNGAGQITEMYGRKILGARLRKGTAQHLYLPGAHAGVFNEAGLQGQKEVILCEALIDAMTFWCHGFKNVTASYGTQGFTPDHLAAFKQAGIERVLIAYDRDEAGNTAALSLAADLQKAGFDCFRIQFPKGMDANSYALEVTPAAKSLGLVIRKAEWLGKGKEPEIETVEELGNTTASESIVVEKEPLPAESVIPEAPAQRIPDAAAEVTADISEHEIHIPLGERVYRIRGLSSNMSYERMQVNLLVKQGEYLHVDQLNLYQSKARQSFIKQASVELGCSADTLKTDIGKVLLKLEALQDEQIKGQLAAKDEEPSMTDVEHGEALELLKDSSLLSRLLEDFNACGVVGEETNKLVGYLAATSRKLDKPLAVIIQSSSAAGKSSLMDAVLNLIPDEERVQYSAMTGQSLFYMGETNLKHKILAIAEEEGAAQASYALKLLQSEGEVSIASTGKDENTGNLVTKSYKVEGPVMLFLTTTAIDIDEELMNRCLVLSVNESREQTDAIHALQRDSQTLEGLVLQEERKRLTTLHRNAQRLLKPLKVVNPHAKHLTFDSSKTRSRRDHMKYLQLINSITLLHQFQREIKQVKYREQVIDYIEVTLSDIDKANSLAHEVLGRSLDELPPQTRKLLNIIYETVNTYCQSSAMKQSDYRFTRKDVRAACGWTDMQVKRHMQRLQELEYVLVHKGGRGLSIVYELLYQGEGTEGSNFLMGLFDVDLLQCDEQTNPLNHRKSVARSAQVRPKIGGSAISINALQSTDNVGERCKGNELRQAAIISEKNHASHRTDITAVEV